LRHTVRLPSALSLPNGQALSQGQALPNGQAADIALNEPISHKQASRCKIDFPL